MAVPIMYGDYWCSPECKLISKIEKSGLSKSKCIFCRNPFIDRGTKANKRSICSSGCRKKQRIKKKNEAVKIIKPAYRPLQSKDFYECDEWRRLRYKALRLHNASGRKGCCLCGSEKKPYHVDHIKPRSKYPDLEWDLGNLQILCLECNLGKSNEFEDDWRSLDVCGEGHLEKVRDIIIRYMEKKFSADPKENG